MYTFIYLKVHILTLVIHMDSLNQEKNYDVINVLDFDLF